MYNSIFLAVNKFIIPTDSFHRISEFSLWSMERNIHQDGRDIMRYGWPTSRPPYTTERRVWFLVIYNSAFSIAQTDILDLSVHRLRNYWVWLSTNVELWRPYRPQYHPEWSFRPQDVALSKWNEVRPTCWRLLNDRSAREILEKVSD